MCTFRCTWDKIRRAFSKHLLCPPVLTPQSPGNAPGKEGLEVG